MRHHKIGVRDSDRLSLPPELDIWCGFRYFNVSVSRQKNNSVRESGK